MEKLLYGAAYYDEYMPYERCEKDANMMEAAGMNVVRIGESTWSTYEKQDGIFDFAHLGHVMDIMEKHHISVIIGTPTYAVPTWLVRKYPDIMATTSQGKNLYGPRQNMDITNPDYLRYAERIIRKMMEYTAHRKCVIGFQVDNETKYYDTAGEHVQNKFIAYLKGKFHNSCDEMNEAFGLDYWSNRINSWDDFPDVRGTINGSLASAFDQFRRNLVTEFLDWQGDIMKEYKREDQFITHNLDFAWRGHSYGIQPMADHYQIARNLTIAGTDIYHPSQDMLTGEEIAFCGDVIRGLKRDNYLVLETQAQGFPDWTPYQDQLRLQAYSHLASGANGVEYWHWHSLHNAVETYWKGVLSHDLEENEVYRECSQIGQEWSKIGSHLIDLQKKNKVAFLVSNTALTALHYFKLDASAGTNGSVEYNDVVRNLYHGLYLKNVECDMLWEEQIEEISKYKLVFIPALYAVKEEILVRLKEYVEKGGCLVATCKTAYADENVKVYSDRQPHILQECFGMYYQQFTFPKKESAAVHFMELLIPQTAEVWMQYDLEAWHKYAAVTGNSYGKGYAVYIGCLLQKEKLGEMIDRVLQQAGIEKDHTFEDDQSVIIRRGVNKQGHEIIYYLNYSSMLKQDVYQEQNGNCLLSGEKIKRGDLISLYPWNLEIIEIEK